jgi:hypothetical protein
VDVDGKLIGKPDKILSANAESGSHPGAQRNPASFRRINSFDMMPSHATNWGERENPEQVNLDY